MRIASRFFHWFAGPAQPWSSWVVDGATLAYALWTAVCHAVMLLGGSTHTLVWTITAIASGAAIALVVWGAARFRRRGATPASATEPSAVASAPSEPDAGHTSARVHLALGAAALVLLVFWRTDAGYLPKWLALCAYLLLALALSLRAPIAVALRTPGTRSQQAALWALALASAWLSLYVHRWRNDDCFYVNLAVTMADIPHAALLAVNTIHAPIDGALQPVWAPYRVHSFEALGGYVSLVTGIPAIEVIHLGLGAIGSLLIPLALARLFAALDPRRWLPMVFVAMCIYLFEGSSGLGYGNHGIVRSFTGKSVMLSVAIPVLVHNAFTFARAPSLWRWVLLLAVQVCAVGLSSTALWLAPLATMLAVIAGLQIDRRALRPFSLALLSCAYVLGLALWVRAQLLPSVIASADSAGGGSGASADKVPDFGLMYWWLKKMFAEIPVADRYLALIVVAIAACRTVALRRYLVLFCGVLAFALMNPYLGELVRLNITGWWTGERVLFLLPLPAAVAAVFCAALPTHRGMLARALGMSVMVLGSWAFFTTVPLKPVLAPTWDTTYHWPPGPKVPPIEHEIAALTVALALGDQQVLAPEIVSWYLPTLHHHPYPVLANAKYLAASKGEKKRRKRLVELVSRHQSELTGKDRLALLRGLARYHVGAVVLTRNARHTRGLLAAIEEAGFAPRERFTGYEVWTRRE